MLCSRLLLLVICLMGLGAPASAQQDGPAPIPSSLADGQAFDDCNGETWCPPMIVIPAGDFVMGSAPGEPGRNANEGPRHTVHVPRFAAGKYEVTFAQWDACVADGGCKTNPLPNDQGWGRGNRPVIGVSWNDAQEYVDWLTRRTGHAYRLLSEAEWEYAARAGTQTRFWWGRNTSPRQAQYNWGYNGAPNYSAPGRTAEVGSFTANAFGLSDVHGNVSEWVADCYRDSYVPAPAPAPHLLRSCFAHVLRGGSWNDIVPELRSAARDYPIFGERGFSMWGFRVARSLSDDGTAPVEANVIWADWPEWGYVFVDYYDTHSPRPPRGHADLSCLVADDGRAQCSVIAESAPGYDYGETALQVAAELRAQPFLSDGVTPSAGALAQVTINFPD